MDVWYVRAHDPFGMMLSGRNWETGTAYRYGFNGQEQDDEVYGNGNINTAEYWGYDTRLGRRWNVDPVIKSDLSCYSVFSNSPIVSTDVKGDNDDWFQDDSNGSIRWIDSNADTYVDMDGKSFSNIGTSITIETKSDIKTPTDIPLGNAGVEGNKLTCRYTITGVTDENGKLKYFESSLERKTGKTWGVITGTSDVAGKENDYDAIQQGYRNSWYGTFEQHTEVNPVEGIGLKGILGANKVDVNVDVFVNISSNGYLGIDISHGTYPSVDMTIVASNKTGGTFSTNVYNYQQCSFALTHIKKTSALWITQNKSEVKAMYNLFIDMNKSYSLSNKSYVHFTGYNAGTDLFDPATNTIKF